jgi:hypothetical protein
MQAEEWIKTLADVGAHSKPYFFEQKPDIQFKSQVR